MRTQLLAAAATLAVAVASPAFAQSNASSSMTGANTMPSPSIDMVQGHQPGSTVASNILPSDTHTIWSPQLPVPPIGRNASPAQFLHQAQVALANRRTGEAQEALERAETRLLDRSTMPGAANTPDGAPSIHLITQALDALGRGHLQQARAAVGQAMQTPRIARAGAAAFPAT